MSTQMIVMSAFFVFVILLFVAGMFIFPELFGISKKNDPTLEDPNNDDVK